jgi:hypothetical protein
MNKRDTTVVIAARILRLQYQFYARPARDMDGSPVLHIWKGNSRDDVDLSVPDYSIRLSHTRLTWVVTGSGRVIMGTLGGGKSLADEVVKMIRFEGR